MKEHQLLQTHVVQASVRLVRIAVMIAAQIAIMIVAQIAIKIAIKIATKAMIVARIARIVFNVMEPKVAQTAIATATVDVGAKVRVMKAHRAVIDTNRLSQKFRMNRFRLNQFQFRVT
jgi:hypothetical protein